MSRVYKTQSYLRIELSYTADVSDGISSVKIKYVDPTGTTGEWTAQHDGVNKIIYYEVPLGFPLGKAGRWTVWSYATMDDGRILPGDPFKFVISTEGE